MKLIQQTTLHYQEGSSNKIYEVDLCQVGDRYVVNFRYGRRGANLKEGVKTTQPVTLPEARKIFDKLIAEKVNKGYQDVTVLAPSQTQTAETIAASPVATVESTRAQTILNHLVKAGSKKWPLERVIWRAGELKIRQATPLIISFIGSGNALRDYCIAWALGWCGGEGASDGVSRLYRNADKPEFVRRIAFEALLKLSDESTQMALRSEKIEQLPIELRDLVRNGSSEEFSNALHAYLNRGNYQHFAVLDTLYHIDSESIRPALLEILRTAPLRPNYFQRLRHIFKIAEYRLDAEVFGILTYRFEKQKAMFAGGKSSAYESYWDAQIYRYRNRTYEEQLKSPESKFAYGQNTRAYLLRRAWRSLRNLGETGDPNYVKMAVGLLIPYSDADAEPVKHGEYYRWNRSNWQREIYKQIDWDIYAGYLTFNHILYENSPRYILAENSTAWRCREGYKPGNPEPSVREEAFPELWQQQPAEVLRLIIASNCTSVNQFAVKVLRTCPQFLAELNTESVIALLKRPYAIAAQLGFELASDRYNPNSPNFQLILALANCAIAEARSQAYQWIEQQRETFLQDNNFIAVLVTSQQSETRQFARRLISSSILSDTAAKVLIARMIAELLTLPATQIEMAKEIGEILLSSFTPQLRTIGLQIVLDLLTHTMPELQEIGARILLNHETSAVNLPPGWIDSLIDSPYESVRGIGIRLFGQLPDEMLLQRYLLLLMMATHELADIRNAIRPVLSRLATNNTEFGARLATELIELMLTSETPEDVRNSVMRLLKEDLPGWMSNIPLEIVWKLLRAKSTAAQELAGVVLQANCLNWSREFETSEIVKLANYEILAVREAAREMLLQIRDRLHGNEEELLAAVRILESKWKDSRDFGERMFSEFFTSEDFTPTVLVSLCDSVREEVRQFGRNMVIRHFQEVDGQDYLLKFSEHPSTDMQLFATNYLETYAAGNAERLQELMPYFISVLSRVNRGGVAKRRIFAFLDAEALKSEAAARIVAEILTRQSATIAIGDKATAIQIMVKIHRAYPQISLPILVKPVANWTS